MKFFVDAQLPRRLARLLITAAHDAVHTFDLPKANRTPDGQIETLAENEQRVVITKDNDFVASFWLHGRPAKPLLISTGNISNDELFGLINQNLNRLVAALSQYNFVELSRENIVIHA